MQILKQTEQALVLKLMALVYHPTLNAEGVLKSARVFRGSQKTADDFFKDMTPCALLLRKPWRRVGDYGIEMKWLLSFRSDNKRSEEDAFSGSALPGESPGLDEVGNVLFALFDHQALDIGELAAPDLPLVSVSGGGPVGDEAGGAYGESLELSVELPRFEF